jgi:hypothetical protein
MPTESGAVALVRLNITDLDEETPLLTDQQIQSLLEHYDGSTNRASARALRIIAASEVLVGKVIRTQDLQTNADRVAEALRKLAEDYDREAEAEELTTEGALNIVPFGGRHRLEAEGWRQ